MTMNLDAAWGQTQADGPTEDAPPPVGTYVPMVHEFRAFTSKKGEFVVAVGFQTEQYRWSDVRVLTKNGVPQEGRIKACKIMLRQLGVNPDTPPSQLEHIGSQLVGRYFAVDVVDSGRVNQTSGTAILNTNITGPASAPTMNVAQPQAPQAPAVQVPHEQRVVFGSAADAFPMNGEPAQPAQVAQAEVDRSAAIQPQQAQQPNPHMAAAVQGAVFPAAVPGGQPTVVQPQQPAAGAQFGDTPPWS